MTAPARLRVQEERDKTSRGSHDGCITSGENAVSNTASVLLNPDYARKSSSRRRVSAIELPRLQKPGHSNRKCSMWSHLCYLVA